MTTSTRSADAIGLPDLIHATRSMPRRGFLAGLTRLPLIGGSVALLGQPSAGAGTATPNMIEAYKTWLEYERRALSWEMAADPLWQHRYRNFDGADRVELAHSIDHCFTFVRQSHTFAVDNGPPSTRAALVMSTVGCDWRESDERAMRRRA